MNDREINEEQNQYDILVMGQECKSCGHFKAKLTRMESVVYNYMIQGWTTKDTAKEVCLSPKTVHTYRYRIKKKLGLETSQQGTAPLLLHYISERAIIIRQLFNDDDCGGVSPEFLSGYLEACDEFHHPDIRLITNLIGVKSSRKELPPIPPR